MKGFLTVFFIFVSFFAFGQDFDRELNKANSKFFDENYQDAIEEYQKLIDSGIGDTIQRSWAYGYVGVCFQKLSQVNEAKENYRRAIDMGTPCPGFYSKLLAIYKSERSIEGQEFVLLSKKKNMPHEYRKTMKSLAYLYVNSKQFNKLLTTCDELIEWDPENYKYHYFKAISYQKLKNIEKAKLEYRKAIELKSDDVNSNMNLGMILFLKANKTYDVAVDKYEAIAKPTDDDYQLCKKKLAGARNKMREAEPFLVISYKLKPNKNLKSALFNLYRKCSEHAKANNYQ
ncbi:MAG: hypothetical protein JKX79_11375 [Labilibaculum sp.]|nr:hypothetical protein [Labilibaculum sp.]